jgi:hypothetical protein
LYGDYTSSQTQLENMRMGQRNDLFERERERRTCFKRIESTGFVGFSTDHHETVPFSLLMAKYFESALQQQYCGDPHFGSENVRDLYQHKETYYHTFTL